MCEATGVRPLIDHEVPLASADEALRHVAAGDLFGKIVLTLKRMRPKGRTRQRTRPTTLGTAPNWRESVEASGASPTTQ